MNKKLLVLFLGILIFCGLLIYFYDKNEIEILSDNINYNTKLAVYIQNENGNYNISSSIPLKGSGYKFSQAVCKNNVVAEWDNDNWSLIVPNSNSSFKCNLYFDLQKSAIDVILANKTISTRTDFSTPFSDDTTGIIYTALDDDGTSYYFSGSPRDNYVKFGKWASNTPDVYVGYNYTTYNSSLGYFSTLSECQATYSNCTLVSRANEDMYWRIVRINGDGSVRLIYAGTSALENGTVSVEPMIVDSTFNDSADDRIYVGFMYASGKGHGLSTNSIIKSELDTWYSSNLASYTSYIDQDAGFCGDRTAYSGLSAETEIEGTGTGTTYFAARNRLSTYNNSPSPIFTCKYNEDLYTKSGASKGNKALTYPVGLLTADEAVYAGIGFSTSTKNKSYYLFSGITYWTMTPYGMDSPTNIAYVFADDDGYLAGYMSTVKSSRGVRPVINLKSDVWLTGSGTIASPYQIIS